MVMVVGTASHVVIFNSNKLVLFLVKALFIIMVTVNLSVVFDSNNIPRLFPVQFIRDKCQIPPNENLTLANIVEAVETAKAAKHLLLTLVV